MTMRLHHLNCGTMHTPGEAIVCHVLLLETPTGLVLVDSGYGLADIASPGARLGPARFMLKPALVEHETAIRQVAALGFDPADVRDIVVTHFDIDHIGGIADFPHARIHTTSAEVLGAITAPSWRERIRYSGAQWAHGPRLEEHIPDGDAWRGFAAAKELTDVAEGLVLVALPGHTRGHAAVAVHAAGRWLLHAGDAFYHRGTLDPSVRVPRALALSERSIAFDRRQVVANHERLRELHDRREPDIEIVSAHDGELLSRATQRTAAG